MTIYQQYMELLKGKEGEIVTLSYIQEELNKKYGTNISSIILADYCYNRYNRGIGFNKHIFQYISKGTYKFIGENYPYTGLIFHRPKYQQHEIVVGEWVNGKKHIYDIHALESRQDASNEFINISKIQIAKLFEEYNNILHLELNILKCNPTELKHLIGRIGEFFCALKTDGVLTQRPNQQGFDVISKGRRISVKTTAQKGGFIAINQNTFKYFDDLFVIQYFDDEFKLIFYGPKEKILNIARVYNTNYEVDISKLSKIQNEQIK